MEITTLDGAPTVPFNIDGRIMFSCSRAEVIHLTLMPGNKLEMHDNLADVVFYMLQGSLFLLLEAGEKEIKTDSCLEIKRGILRGWENRRSEKARMLVIKLPESTGSR